MRSDDGSSKWIDAPDVRLLHGEEGGAEWKRLQGTVDSDLKRAAERLYLVGSTPQNLRREYVGTFIMQSGPRNGSNGRHVYHRQGTDKAAMWYDGDGMWRVGSLLNIGTSNSVLALPGSLALPEESQGVWRVKHPLGSAWLDAPALRLLHGEEGRAALKAEEVSRQGRVKAAAAQFRLSGETPCRVFHMCRTFCPPRRRAAWPLGSSRAAPVAMRIMCGLQARRTSPGVSGRVQTRQRLQHQRPAVLHEGRRHSERLVARVGWQLVRRPHRNARPVWARARCPAHQDARCHACASGARRCHLGGVERR